MKDAGIECVQTVSPKNVLHFLKTYKMDVQNRCEIEKVDIPVKDTRMGNMNVVTSLLHYCVRDESLNDTDFEHVPLLLTADGYLREFRNDRIIYLVKFPNLLPNSTNMMAHHEHIYMRTLESCSGLQIFVKKAEIVIFAKLLCDNISSSYCTKFSIVWNPKSNAIPNLQWMKCFWDYIAQTLHSYMKEEQAKYKKAKEDREKAKSKDTKSEEDCEKANSKDTKSEEDCEKAKSKDTKSEEDCEKSNSKDTKSEEGREKAKSKGTKTEKEFLQDFATHFLVHLGKWNFVPALVKRNSDSKVGDHVIFPLSHGKKVLRLIDGEYSDEQNALKGLGVPLLDEMCLPSLKRLYGYLSYLPVILQSVVATFKNVKDILDCLYLNCSKLNRKNHCHCLTVLEYFGRNLKTLQQDSHSKEKLASLPLYYSTFDGCVSVLGENVIILPEDVPKEGLKEWSVTQGILFIEEKSSLAELYCYTECRKVTEFEFYMHFLLPNIHDLPPATVVFHMKYIKDMLGPSVKYKSKTNKLEQTQLDGLLKEIPFLPTDNGKYARACEFFNPHEKIFQLKNRLCKPSELPPKPFDEDEWKEFLIRCGMKNEFTTEIFLEMANRLQELGNAEGLTPLVLGNSEYLVRILFSYDSNLIKSFPFMNQVKHIDFVCPHKVSMTLTRIVAQHENDGKLICFQKSTFPSNQLLSWSSMKIISEMTHDAMKVLPKEYQVAVRKALELYDSPPIQHVVTHVKNICSPRNQLSELIARRSENENVVTKIMLDVYIYLQKNINDIHAAALREVPFIFIKNRGIFTIPQRVVLNMNEDEEIPPYFYKAPVYFGQFQSVFQACGAADTLLCKHLANVLHEIYVASKGKVLEPNERRSTKMAVQQLFRKLQVDGGSKVILPALYLPSKNYNLVQSDEMVFVDDQLIEQRIGSSMPDLDFFIGFRNMEMLDVDPLTEIGFLPESRRPKLLSRIVTEKLKPDCKEMNIQSDFACCLQQFLRCKKFFSGFCRLVRHEFYRNDKTFDKSQQLKIWEKMQLISVFHLEKLETVLVCKNATLSNTERQKRVFGEVHEDANNSAELHIFFKTVQTLDTAVWINDISKELSIILNTFLGDFLLKCQLFLPDVLKYMQDPGMIEHELNNHEIMAVEMEHVLNILPFMPELGTEISIAMHHLLDNSCTFIETGQYVAYEVSDPIVDEDEPNSEDMPVYILAKVIETITECVFDGPNAKEWNISYRIDVGGEEKRVAEASRVYKFIRKDEADKDIDVVDGAVIFHWNIDRVKVYIRDVMRNAFGRTKSEFRRTVKRLLLQYHPDKHTENKDYYDNLTKFINFIKERLEHGESVEDADIFSSDMSGPQNNPSSGFWNWCYNRGSVYATNSRDYSGSNDSSHSSFFHAFDERGPQPGQAKRWYKQAEIDFNAASSDQNGPNAYNWACYKCHQAVEKALKALLYQIDADKVSLNTHKLSSLACSVNDVNLSGCVDRLESITGSYFRMRYPDAVPGGTIPSDLYTEEHARRAIECAQEILQMIQLRIPSV